MHNYNQDLQFSCTYSRDARSPDVLGRCSVCAGVERTALHGWRGGTRYLVVK